MQSELSSSRADGPTGKHRVEPVLAGGPGRERGGVAGDRIECIVLAAGESKRMGRPKLLLRLGQSTVLEQTVDNLLNSEVNRVIVVLGDRAEEVVKPIANRAVAVAVNPDYRRGMSTSIVAGLSLINDKTRAVMLALADQPFIDTPTVNRLIDEFRAHNRGIAIPVYQGRRGHPVIFAIEYKEELLRLRGDAGGKLIIEQHPQDVLEVDVDCEGINIDIDTEDGYQRERSRLK